MGFIGILPWQIYAGIAAGFVSLTDILSKKVLMREHSVQYILAMDGFYAAISIPLIWFINFPNLKIVFPWILLSVILGAVGQIFTVKSMRHLELSSIMPLFNLSTLISVVIAIFFLGEKFSALKGLGVALMVLGTFLIERSQGPFSITFKDKTHLYPFIPVVLYAFLHVINKKVLGTLDIISLFAANSFLYFFIYYFFSIFWGYRIKEFLNDSYGHDKKMIFGIGSGAIASDFAYYFALKQAPVSLVLPIFRLHSLTSVIFGGKYFHEHHLRLRIISTIVILVGLYLIVGKI